MTIDNDSSRLVATVGLRVGDRVDHEGSEAIVTAMLHAFTAEQEPTDVVLVGLEHVGGSSWHFVSWSHAWLYWAERPIDV